VRARRYTPPPHSYGTTGSAFGWLMTIPTRRAFLAAGGLAAAALLGRPARAAALKWVDRRSYGPFRCVSAFPLAPLDEFFQGLSGLEQELQRTLAVPPTRATVEVFLLADENSHRQFIGELYPHVPYRRALYVQRAGRGAVYAYQHAELPVDLRHECTHALLHANLSMVPLWLDEGLAEYFEPPEAARAFEHPHLSTLRWNLRLGMLRTVDSLEEHSELNDMGGVEYRFAWGWVHFMLHGPVNVHRALVEYLADIRRGESPGLLSERLRAVQPELDERMIQHFKHWRRA
jgi:hypothetical protein